MRRSLERAATLYRGDFCEGLDAYDGEVTRSIDLERTRLRTLAYQIVARARANGSDAAGENESSAALTEAAIALAHRLLARDPLHEGSHRALMILLERAGLRAEALHVFETCRKVAARRARRRTERRDGGRSRGGFVAPANAGDCANRGAAPASPTHTTIARLFHDRAAPAAVDHLVRAWHLLSSFTPESNRLARVEAETAAAIDPTYIEALTMAGWTHFFDWTAGWSDEPEVSHEHARIQVARAFATGRTTVGPASTQRDAVVLDAPSRRGARAGPSSRSRSRPSSVCRTSTSPPCCLLGFARRGQRSIARARKLDPQALGMFQTVAAMSDFFAGAFDSALRNAHAAVARSPTYPWAHWAVAAVESQLGNFEAARTAARAARAVAPRMGAGFAPGKYLPFRLERDRKRLAAAYAQIGDGVRFPPYERDDTVVPLTPRGRVSAIRPGGDGGRGG